MPPEAKPFNPAEYLTTPASVYAFLNEALQTKDTSFIASAFGIVAESKGVEIIAQHSNPNCSQLCLAVSEADGHHHQSWAGVRTAGDAQLAASRCGRNQLSVVCLPAAMAGFALGHGGGHSLS